MPRKNGVLKKRLDRKGQLFYKMLWYPYQSASYFLGYSKYGLTEEHVNKQEHRCSDFRIRPVLLLQKGMCPMDTTTFYSEKN
jgi:hypothetical protein